MIVTALICRGCDQPADGLLRRELCSACYSSWRRHGKPLGDDGLPVVERDQEARAHRGSLCLVEATHEYTLLHGEQRAWTYYYYGVVARATADGRVLALRPPSQPDAKLRTLVEYTGNALVERVWLVSAAKYDLPAAIAALNARTGEATFPTLDAARAFLRPFCRVEVAT